jgi:hypothetical protein
VSAGFDEAAIKAQVDTILKNPEQYRPKPKQAKPGKK